MTTTNDPPVRYWQPVPGGPAEFLCGQAGAGPAAPHVHAEWQLAVADEPATLLVGAYRRQPVLPDQVAVTQPYDVHGEAGGGTWRILYVADSLMRAIAGEAAPANLLTPLPGHPSPADELRALLRESEAGALTGAGFADAATPWLRRFVAGAGEPVPSTARRSHSAVERVRSYLRDRPAHAVSLAEVVTLAGVAPSRLVRAFTREVGLPPRSYHLHARLALARRLLLEGRPVGWVTYECGFADQSHLSRRFKQCYRLTPGAFQAQCASTPTGEPGTSAA